MKREMDHLVAHDNRRQSFMMQGPLARATAEYSSENMIEDTRRAHLRKRAEPSPARRSSQFLKKFGVRFRPKLKLPRHVGDRPRELGLPVGLTVQRTIGYIAEVIGE
jgi:hypothetical protein